MPHTSLNPCPACGAVDTHVSEWFSDDGEVNYRGVCDVCGFEDDAHCDTEWDAVDHWNHRPHSAGEAEPYGEDPYNVTVER